MSLFKNQKKKISPLAHSTEIEHSAANIDYVRDLGSSTVAATVEKQSPSADEIMARLNTISDAQSELLCSAVDKDVPHSELPTLVADAINNGTLPRIVEGFRTRGNAMVYLLNAQVPAEALSVSARHIPEVHVPAKEVPGYGFTEARTVPSRFVCSVMLNPRYIDSPVVEEALSVPTYGNDVAHAAIIEKIDSYFQLPLPTE